MKERKIYYLTEEGAKDLEQRISEIRERMKKKSEWLIDSPALSPAIEDYYHDQLELNRLLSIQKQSHIVNQEEAKKMGIGRKITILDPEVGEPEEFIVLSSQESEPTGGIISFESPLAKATLGRGDGEVIELKTPEGNKRITLLQTDWIFFDVNDVNNGQKQNIREDNLPPRRF